MLRVQLHQTMKWLQIGRNYLRRLPPRQKNPYMSRIVKPRIKHKSGTTGGKAHVRPMGSSQLAVGSERRNIRAHPDKKNWKWKAKGFWNNSDR
jgi:hypothetical protein